MKILGRLVFSTLIVALIFSPVSFASETSGSYSSKTKTYKLGDKVDAFTLKDANGKSYNLSDYLGKHIIVLDFWNCNCPVSRGYESQRKSIIDGYKGKDVTYLAIDSNHPNDLKLINNYAKKKDLNYVVLKDPHNKIADKFAAQRTPEIFVIAKDHRIRYHGAISDNQIEKQVKNRYLADALNALVAGNSVKTDQTNAIGCSIKRMK
jgi:peroxiredoxin